MFLPSLWVGSIAAPVKFLLQGVVRELLGAAILCEHDLLLCLAFAQAAATEIPLRIPLAAVGLGPIRPREGHAQLVGEEEAAAPRRQAFLLDVDL